MIDKDGNYSNNIRNSKVKESVQTLKLPGGLGYPAIHADFYEELADARAEIERLKTPTIDDSLLREKLAELAHNQWAGWMEYLFLKSKQVDGCVIIPAWAVDRWRRQVATRYSDLSEDEKNSDRNEADRFLSLFNAEIEHRDALIGQMREALFKLIGTLEVMSVMPETIGKYLVLVMDAPELEQARAALEAAERLR